MAAVDRKPYKPVLVKHRTEDSTVGLVRRASVWIVVDDHIAGREPIELFEEVPNGQGQTARVNGDPRRLRNHVSVAIEEPTREVLAFTKAGRVGGPDGRGDHLLHRRDEIIAQDLRGERIESLALLWCSSCARDTHAIPHSRQTFPNSSIVTVPPGI